MKFCEKQGEIQWNPRISSPQRENHAVDGSVPYLVQTISVPRFMETNKSERIFLSFYNDVCKALKLGVWELRPSVKDGGCTGGPCLNNQRTKITNNLEGKSRCQSTGKNCQELSWTRNMKHETATNTYKERSQRYLHKLNEAEEYADIIDENNMCWNKMIVENNAQHSQCTYF